MRARHHVLIAQPVEFDPRRSQPLLRVEAPSAHAIAAPWSRRMTTPSSPRHRALTFKQKRGLPLAPRGCLTLGGLDTYGGLALEAAC